MIEKLLEEWLFEDVELTFGIERIEEMPALVEWLSVDEELVALPSNIEKLRKSLSRNVETWNEDELKMMFISPFLLEFDFNRPPLYRIFSQRLMKFQNDKVDIAGRVEWMIATGKQTPRQPFFFMQEYKPEKGSNNDPLGQLLIAMVDVQSRNESSEQALYGCYTIGRFWFFVLLIGKQYGVSRAYDATQVDDISSMIIILKRVEAHIHQLLGVMEG